MANRTADKEEKNNNKNVLKWNGKEIERTRERESTRVQGK